MYSADELSVTAANFLTYFFLPWIAARQLQNRNTNRYMMALWYENAFQVTAPVCGKSISDRWVWAVDSFDDLFVISLNELLNKTV